MLLACALLMPSSAISVLLSGPRVFSEKDDPQDSIRPQTKAVTFQRKGNSPGALEALVEGAMEFLLRPSSVESAFSATTAWLAASLGPMAIFSEVIVALIGVGPLKRWFQVPQSQKEEELNPKNRTVMG